MNTAEGTMRFRRAVLIFSIIFAAITMLILVSDTKECPSADLRIGLWLSFSVHITSFTLLLFHFIGLGFILRKLGRILGLYFFYLVGAMFATQVIFFKSKDCNLIAPLLYFWVLTNIVMFYVLVAYGIALWGAYICWESEKEEKQLQMAMSKYMKKMTQKERSKGGAMMLDMEKGLSQKLLAIDNKQSKKKNKKKQQESSSDEE